MSSWLIAGLAGVAALGAVFAALEQGWGWALVLGCVAGWLGWSSAVHRGGGFAGGVWLTPTRLRHEDPPAERFDPRRAGIAEIGDPTQQPRDRDAG